MGCSSSKKAAAVAAPLPTAPAPTLVEESHTAEAAAVVAGKKDADAPEGPMENVIAASVVAAIEAAKVSAYGEVDQQVEEGKHKVDDAADAADRCIDIADDGLKAEIEIGKQVTEQAVIILFESAQDAAEVAQEQLDETLNSVACCGLFDVPRDRKSSTS